jgi:hypothetical protein
LVFAGTARKAAAEALPTVITTAQIKGVIQYFAIMRFTLENFQITYDDVGSLRRKNVRRPASDFPSNWEAGHAPRPGTGVLNPLLQVRVLRSRRYHQRHRRPCGPHQQ